MRLPWSKLSAATLNNLQPASAFCSMKAQIAAYKAVRRMAMSVVALHVAAMIID